MRKKHYKVWFEDGHLFVWAFNPRQAKILAQAYRIEHDSPYRVVKIEKIK